MGGIWQGGKAGVRRQQEGWGEAKAGAKRQQVLVWVGVRRAKRVDGLV